MIAISQSMVQSISAQSSLASVDAIYTVFLQVSNSAPESTVGSDNVLTEIGASLGTSVPNLIRAIIILVVGWVVSLIAAALVRSLLKKINVDNRLATWVSGHSSTTTPPIENWISTGVFWIIFIFTIVAFLQALQLTAASEPLNNFLNQIVGYVPQLVGAIILLSIAWLVATLVKLIVTRSLQAFNIDQRLGEQVAPPADATPASATVGSTVPQATPTVQQTTTAPVRDEFLLSETIGNTLYWFIFLLFLPSILNTLGLQGTLEPVQQLLNDILSIIPNLLAALLIGAAGWLVAQVIRRIVTNFLLAAGADRLGSRFGLTQTRGAQSLSSIIGTIVFVLILIPTAIAALNTLRIDAISVPAIAMLNDILGALPEIFTATIILIAAYAVGQFVAELVTSILTSIGFNNVFYWLGLQAQPGTVPAPPAAQPEQVEGGQVATPTLPQKTPSEVIGIVVWIGILLFAAVAAINILNIEALTTLITGIIVIAGRILAGLVVFAIGLYLANLAYTLITSSGGRQARILGQTARISIITLISAMALQQIGVASNIVNLAFGLLLGAVAVAIALAFGLGGRDVAAEQLREWLAAFRRNY